MSVVKLEIIDGSKQGECFEFKRHGSFVCGRANNCQCKILGDPKISRHHFRLETNPPKAHIMDLDSSNGTFVNGARISSHELGDGDVVSVGAVKFRFIGSKDPGETVDCDPATARAMRPGGSTNKGTMIGPYQLVDEIGRGAMGIVYRAVHQSTQKEVALKLVIPRLARGAKSMHQFLREANLLCQLKNPRIVDFIEMGMFEDQVFIAMEFIEQLDIMATLSAQKPENRIRIGCGIASFVLEGLDYIHQHDVVHRDVKPSNVLVFSNQGKIAAKLADFGLAKNYQNAGFSGITQANEAKGTLACMPPEQIIDCCGSKPSCDIYSAGATLYFYLTGSYPHQTDPDRLPTFGAILDSEPVPICERDREIPAELGAIIMRSLARLPVQRQSSAGHFHNALREFCR